MKKKLEQEEPTTETPTTLADATIAGLLLAKKIKVVPFLDGNKRIQFAAYGNVERALKEIYENQPCGSLDMLNGIKSARGMIWNLKGGR